MAPARLGELDAHWFAILVHRMPPELRVFCGIALRAARFQF
jgi:hypothetical protein